MDAPAIKKDVAYLVAPRLGGFANDTIVETEDGKILYHVESKLFSLSGRQYTVTSENGAELLATEQDHTVLFPRHAMFQGGIKVGMLGQIGIIPQKYFVDIRQEPRAEIHMGGMESIFKLKDEHNVLAEMTQYRSKWIVVLQTEVYAELFLLSLAILSRENTIGG